MFGVYCLHQYIQGALLASVYFQGVLLASVYPQGVLQDVECINGSAEWNKRKKRIFILG